MTFDEVLRICGKTAYVEPKMDYHAQIISEMVPRFDAQLAKASSILDIGCGNCTAANIFRERGHSVCCVSIIKSEADDAARLGFEAHNIDMHEIQTLGQRFDGIWARHVLEHSPCPFYVLLQCYEVLKTPGLIYIEVPKPETECRHEANPNHWSCLPVKAWAHLIGRAAFTNIAIGNITFELDGIGPDEYFQFMASKK